ncbi:hypothetical protein Tco_1494115 [Tanacetum coccineum]
MECNTTADDYPFNAEFEMPTSADVLREFTPTLEEVSPVCKRSSSTTPLSHAYVERCKVPTADAQNASVGRNVQICLLKSHSGMPINASGILGTTKPHLGPAGTIGNHDTADRNCVPISRFFDRFRNAVRFKQILLLLVFAANEDLTANAQKRKNAHPLLIVRPKEASSSRNIKGRLAPTSLKAPCANANRNYPPVNSQNLNSNSSRSKDDTPYYMDLGGQIYMPVTPDPPAFIQQLLKNTHFIEHIRAYNQMFAMTSFGAKIDELVNKGKGPCVFKISGQIYHWIGSLFPEEGHHLRFLQLYIYDTRDEVNKRMQHFGGLDEGILNPKIVQGLIHVFDEHNGSARLFRTARDRCNAGEVPRFKIRLYNMGGVHGYELLTSEILGGIVFERGPRCRTDFDVIIKFRGVPPQRINKLHQLYMSLQFPLSFVFGQPGFYPKLTLKPHNAQIIHVHDTCCGRKRKKTQRFGA